MRRRNNVPLRICTVRRAWVENNGLFNVCSYSLCFSPRSFQSFSNLHSLFSYYMIEENKKKIYIYKYILFNLSGASSHWDTICIEIFAIRCKSESKDSVWFIKQWFVLTGSSKVFLVCMHIWKKPQLVLCYVCVSECTTHYALWFFFFPPQ